MPESSFREVMLWTLSSVKVVVAGWLADTTVGMKMTVHSRAARPARSVREHLTFAVPDHGFTEMMSFFPVTDLHEEVVVSLPVV